MPNPGCRTCHGFGVIKGFGGAPSWHETPCPACEPKRFREACLPHGAEVIPLPNLHPPPIDAGEVVSILRRLELDPWMAREGQTSAQIVAVEADVALPFRIRVDLDGPRRGRVSLHLLVNSTQRALFGIFLPLPPDGPAEVEGSLWEIEGSTRRALETLRALGSEIMRRTRVVG